MEELHHSDQGSRMNNIEGNRAQFNSQENGYLPKKVSLKRIFTVLFFLIDISFLGYFGYLLGSSLYGDIISAYGGFTHRFPGLIQLTFLATIITYIYLRIRSLFTSNLSSPSFYIPSIINLSVIVLFLLVVTTLFSGSNLGLGGLILGGYISLGVLISIVISFAIFAAVFFTHYKNKSRFVLDGIFVAVLFLIIIFGTPVIINNVFNVLDANKARTETVLRQENEKTWPREEIDMVKLFNMPDYLETLNTRRVFNRENKRLLPYDYCCIVKPNGDVLALLGKVSDVRSDGDIYFNGKSVQEYDPYPKYRTYSLHMKVSPTGTHLAYIKNQSLYLDDPNNALYNVPNYKDLDYGPRLTSDDFCFSQDNTIFYRYPNYDAEGVSAYNKSTSRSEIVSGSLQNHCDPNIDGLSGGEHDLKRITPDQKTSFISLNGKVGPWFDYVWYPHINGNQVIYGAVLGDDIYFVRQNLSDYDILD